MRQEKQARALPGRYRIAPALSYHYCCIDGKHTAIAKDPKNISSIRSLPLVPEFSAMLTRLKQRQEEYRAVCKDSYNTEYLEYLCVNELGNRFDPNYITDNFRRTLNKNGLRQIRFHDLRHTCASLLLAKGVSMKEIQEWLGHSNFSTTANTYAHLAIESKQNSANVMRSLGINILPADIDAAAS